MTWPARQVEVNSPFVPDGTPTETAVVVTPPSSSEPIAFFATSVFATVLYFRWLTSALSFNGNATVVPTRAATTATHRRANVDVTCLLILFIDALFSARPISAGTERPLVVASRPVNHNVSAGRRKSTS